MTAQAPNHPARVTRGFSVFWETEHTSGLVNWFPTVILAIKRAQRAQVLYDWQYTQSSDLGAQRRTVLVRDRHSLVQACPMIEYEMSADGTERARVRGSRTWVQLVRDVPGYDPLC